MSFSFLVGHLGAAYHSSPKEVSPGFTAGHLAIKCSAPGVDFSAIRIFVLRFACLQTAQSICESLAQGWIWGKDFRYSIFACHRSPLSPSECVSPTLSCSVSFSLVAGMFDG